MPPLPPHRARAALLGLAFAYLVGAVLQPAFFGPGPGSFLGWIFGLFALALLGMAVAVRRRAPAALFGVALVGAAGVASVQLAVGAAEADAVHLVLVLLVGAGATWDPRVPLAQAALGSTAIVLGWDRLDDAPRLLVYLVLAALVSVAVVIERRRVRRHLDAAMRRLEAEATRDELTGLLNRRGLLSLGSSMLAAMRGAGRPVSLLYLDVDGLKSVNDRLGHAAGDRLLQEAGRRLEACCRQTDLVARLGGDEYAVLLAGASVAAAERIAGEVREHVGGELRGLRWGVSVGVAEVGSGALDGALDLADLKMYEQKQRRRAEAFPAPAG